MKSPYKNILRMPVPAEPLIKHWSPVKKIPKSIDGWGNVLECKDVEADEYGE
jgi:hypothetical protein